MNNFARATLTAALTLILTVQAHATRNAADDLAKYFPENPARKLSTVPVDWQQPPLGCVEEMIPHPSPQLCLDLTSVANPLKDWPANISQADHDYWYAQRRGLSYCRAVEIYRREAVQPGSQSAGVMETSWMTVEAINHYDEKVAAVYEASERYGVPPHVLTGAVFQESLFAELGISDDGGNYSCGAEQINLNGWCVWANNQSAADKASMGWPSAKVNCNDTSIVNLSFIKPFYEIAKNNLAGLPEYRLNKSHFQHIELQDVTGQWPAADTQTNTLRFQLIYSFINNCSDPRLGILAKANELQTIYSSYLSDAVKNKDRYSGTTRFQRQCRQTTTDNAFPLHTGWLMAVASYNAGPRAIDAVTYYNRWDKYQFNDPSFVQYLTPDKIVESIYWSGKYNATTDKIDFANVNGAARSWIWFKGCVAQRHVARVMQHVTLLPDFFVDTLEAPFGCNKSTTGPDGKVITSVPPARQTSPGTKTP
ncbi:MAG: hypothetical protein ACXVA9_12000 [Bdellovibrionales bacterium]